VEKLLGRLLNKGKAVQIAHTLPSPQKNYQSSLFAFSGGFYLFGGALLIRPCSTFHPVIGIDDWNSLAGWKKLYDNESIMNILFYSEDLFGNQFGIDANECVILFDVETGEVSRIAHGVDEWIQLILEDQDFMTGCSLFKNWCRAGNSLLWGQRLVPRVPFVLGGGYEVDNLIAMTDLQAINFRASLARQLRHLADGSAVVLRDSVRQGQDR
jgi:hypothetical protein